MMAGEVAVASRVAITEAVGAVWTNRDFAVIRTRIGAQRVIRRRVFPCAISPDEYGELTGSPQYSIRSYSCNWLAAISADMNEMAMATRQMPVMILTAHARLLTILIPADTKIARRDGYHSASYHTYPRSGRRWATGRRVPDHGARLRRRRHRGARRQHLCSHAGNGRPAILRRGGNGDRSLERVRPDNERSLRPRCPQRCRHPHRIRVVHQRRLRRQRRVFCRPDQLRRRFRERMG